MSESQVSDVEQALESGDLESARQMLDELSGHLQGADDVSKACRARLEILSLADQNKLLRPLPVACALGVDGLLTRPLLIPQRHLDAPLTRWYAARIEDTDDESLHLLMAEGEKASAESSDYLYSQIDRETFDSYSQDERFEELTQGRYLEIGEYGAAQIPLIRVFPLTS